MGFSSCLPTVLSNTTLFLSHAQVRLKKCRNYSLDVDVLCIEGRAHAKRIAKLNPVAQELLRLQFETIWFISMQHRNNTVFLNSMCKYPNIQTNNNNICKYQSNESYPSAASCAYQRHFQICEWNCPHWFHILHSTIKMLQSFALRVLYK